MIRKICFSALGLSAMGLTACGGDFDDHGFDTSSDPIEQVTEALHAGSEGQDIDAPWIVNVKDDQECHGVLIHDLWVLTAAHCITTPFNGSRVSFTRTDPNTGVVTKGSQTVDSAAINIHSKYDARTNDNDIALIRLPKPFAPSPYLKPAELPLRPGAVGERVTIATTRPTGKIGVMQGSIILEGAPTTFYVSSTTASACQGDSGSGVITTAGGMNFVTGIASMGQLNGCKAPGEEMIATRVSPYLSWIRGLTREIGGRFKPAPADYDGDRKVDIAAKFDSGDWRIDLAANGFGGWDLTYPGYGGTSLPVPADYDGDGKADLAIKTTAGEWSINHSKDGFATGFNKLFTGYGGSTWLPVPADYDGDGKADLAVKGAGGEWYINYSKDGLASGFNQLLTGYGNSTAVPVPADYDGDGKADLSIKASDGGWLIDYAAGGFGAWNVGVSGYGDSKAFPVPADYDGDRKADLSVKDASGTWYFDYASNGFGAWNNSRSGYGSGSGQVPADYDGDGRADLAIAGADVWYIDYAASPNDGWNVVIPIVF